MKKLLILIFISYSSLICGEWSQISDITSGVNDVYGFDNAYIIGLDSMHIMSVGNKSFDTPWFFKSSDNGVNFKQLFLDYYKRDDKGNVIYKPKRLINFEYMDTLHAIVMCTDFNYWRTEDGGKNWILDSIISKDNESFPVTTYSNLAITNYVDTLFTSIDFGKKWNTFKIKILSEFNLQKGVFFIDNLKIINKNTILADGVYFVDYYNKDNVYFHTISTDFGKTWEITSIKEEFSYYKYFILGNNKIYAVGNVQVNPNSNEYRDLFKISTDGGYTWNLILDTLSTPKQPLDGVEFIDNKNGIAFARDWAKLYRTSDGGMTWKRDFGPEGFQYPPHDYDYLSNGEILAVANTGKVYKWTDPILAVSENKRNEKKNEIIVYPNPVPQNKTINILFFPTYSGDASLSIVDINGKILTSFKSILNKYEVNVSFKPDNDLSAGMYFIQVGYSNGIAERQKFVIE